ncbi:MAG: hypothetical protein M1819_004908 [Sarea resinae]|nr:MAG: hypothetical protein M1819_004908 [Sarea resinae]
MYIPPLNTPYNTQFLSSQPPSFETDTMPVSVPVPYDDMPNKKRKREDVAGARHKEHSLFTSSNSTQSATSSPTNPPTHHDNFSVSLPFPFLDSSAVSKHPAPTNAVQHPLKLRKQSHSTKARPTQPSLTTHSLQSATHTPQKQPRPSLLSSCHICHRRPTTHTLLSTYADCDACGARTCYICLRECEASAGVKAGDGTGPGMGRHDYDYDTDYPDYGDGAHGDRHGPRDSICGRKICSACCVERGEEGLVCCLACLSTEMSKTGTGTGTGTGA